MPMGEYKDFESCVKANADKSNPQAYCGYIKAKVEGTAKHTCKFKRLAKIYTSLQTAKLAGVGQIPTDYRKQLDRGSKRARLVKYYSLIKQPKEAKHSITLSHGELPLVLTAQHSAMLNAVRVAEMEVAFLKPGAWKTKGVPYNYNWDVIENGAKSFIGKKLYTNHAEEGNQEYGIVKDVYTKMVDGVKYLCGLVEIPEVNFTQPLLERIQTGLLKDISSTHDFVINPEDPTKTVQRINGKGLSLVKEGEVSGARVLSLQRNKTNTQEVS